MLSFIRYQSGILLKGVDTLSKYYSIHEFSKIIGVSAQTLRNWDANGKLHPHHTTVSGYRYYSDEQLNQVINVKSKNALQLDIAAFPAINRKMIWNDRMIMLRHIFWQKDSHLR